MLLQQKKGIIRSCSACQFQRGIDDPLRERHAQFRHGTDQERSAASRTVYSLRFLFIMRSLCIIDIGRLRAAAMDLTYHR